MAWIDRLYRAVSGAIVLGGFMALPHALFAPLRHLYIREDVSFSRDPLAVAYFNNDYDAFFAEIEKRARKKHDWIFERNQADGEICCRPRDKTQ